MNGVNLLEIVPQVLNEIILHPVVQSNAIAEKIVREALTAVLSKKFDADPDFEQAITTVVSPRCFYQQDVSHQLNKVV